MAAIKLKLRECEEVMLNNPQHIKNNQKKTNSKVSFANFLKAISLSRVEGQRQAGGQRQLGEGLLRKNRTRHNGSNKV